MRGDQLLAQTRRSPAACRGVEQQLMRVRAAVVADGHRFAAPDQLGAAAAEVAASGAASARWARRRACRPILPSAGCRTDCRRGRREVKRPRRGERPGGASSSIELERDALGRRGARRTRPRGASRRRADAGCRSVVAHTRDRVFFFVASLARRHAYGRRKRLVGAARSGVPTRSAEQNPDHAAASRAGARRAASPPIPAPSGGRVPRFGFRRHRERGPRSAARQ